MPPDPILAAEAIRWVAWARDDLAAARAMTSSTAAVFPSQSCYLSQQATEKALKALLIALDVDFPKTHDLLRLRALIPGAGRVRGMERTDRLGGPGPLSRTRGRCLSR
ncbi:MAG TPA: hypothetical protein DCS97_14110 [Planctomycetes bacterium]|nr:hypothetical protein [Planctomycetota bacterium]